LPFLVSLRLRTIDEHIRRAGSVLTLEEHRTRAKSQLDCCTIFEKNSEPVGMIKVLRSDTEWSIVQFQLVPEIQGHGVGATIIRELQQKAKQAGAILTLGVLVANPAVRLYKRLGFRVVSGSHGILYMQSAA
jgi:ribosomal protein S18 acetylase RimI-like enzyme